MSKRKYKEQVENSPYSKEAEEIGSRLYNLRTEKNLSMDGLVARVESAQREDDRQVKLSRSQYDRYEKGTAFINAEIVYALCEIYHVSPDFLLCGENSVEYNITRFINSVNSENLQLFCDFLEDLSNSLRKIKKDK